MKVHFLGVVSGEVGEGDFSVEVIFMAMAMAMVAIIITRGGAGGSVGIIAFRAQSIAFTTRLRIRKRCTCETKSRTQDAGLADSSLIGWRRRGGVGVGRLSGRRACCSIWRVGCGCGYGCGH